MHTLYLSEYSMNSENYYYYYYYLPIVLRFDREDNTSTFTDEISLLLRISAFKFVKVLMVESIVLKRLRATFKTSLYNNNKN